MDLHHLLLAGLPGALRYTPESGLKTDIVPCPKSAKRRHSASDDLFGWPVGYFTNCSARLRVICREFISPLTLSRRDIMTIFRRTPAGLVASGVFVLGLFYAAGAVTYADPITKELLL